MDRELKKALLAAQRALFLAFFFVRSDGVFRALALELVWLRLVNKREKAAFPEKQDRIDIITTASRR